MPTKIATKKHVEKTYFSFMWLVVCMYRNVVYQNTQHFDTFIFPVDWQVLEDSRN